MNTSAKVVLGLVMLGLALVVGFAAYIIVGNITQNVYAAVGLGFAALVVAINRMDVYFGLHIFTNPK